MGEKYFSKLKNIRFERTVGFIQQHFRRNVAAVVAWMVEAISEHGEAGDDALVGNTVLRKPNRKLEVNYIVANWEHYTASR